MKNITLILIAALSVSSAFAAPDVRLGPNASGGPQATENLESKLKIKAILDAIQNPNDVIMGIEVNGSSGQYLVTIRNGNCTQKDLFQVRVSNQEEFYSASFVDMIAQPVCQ